MLSLECCTTSNVCTEYTTHTTFTMLHRLKTFQISKEITSLVEKVTAVLLNGWILPISGVASRKICSQPVKQSCFKWCIINTEYFWVNNSLLSF